jgi:hypothetical protein
MLKILILNNQKEDGRFVILGFEIFGWGFGLGASTGKYLDTFAIGIVTYIL